MFANKTPLLLAGLSTLTLLLISCASTVTTQQLSDILEKHPEVLTNAIEKNPDKFMDAVQKAAQSAQAKSQEQAAQQEQGRLEEEFKNPLKPEVQTDRGFLGDAKAPITIVEYTDFECPFCGRGYQNLEKVRKIYGDKVRVLVKNLPLPMHPMAMPSAQVFEALRLHSPEKAYQFYNEVFSNQKKLEAGQDKYLETVIKKVGGDVAKVKADAKSKVVADKIAADMAEAEKFGINGTPAFIINGVSIRGAYPSEAFKTIIDRQLSKK